MVGGYERRVENPDGDCDLLVLCRRDADVQRGTSQRRAELRKHHAPGARFFGRMLRVAARRPRGGWIVQVRERMREADLLAEHQQHREQRA